MSPTYPLFPCSLSSSLSTACPLCVLCNKRALFLNHTGQGGGQWMAKKELQDNKLVVRSISWTSGASHDLQSVLHVFQLLVK